MQHPANTWCAPQPLEFLAATLLTCPPPSPRAPLSPLPPDPSPSFFPPTQRHNGYIYASAHAHGVNEERIDDGDTPVDIDAGFEVAPGDASDIQVVNAHPWGCKALLFCDGKAACTTNFIAKYPDADAKGYLRGTYIGCKLFIKILY